MSQQPLTTPKLPPHSQESEDAVLGSLLNNPDLFDSVAAFLLPEHFYFLHNGWIFQAMINLNTRREKIEYFTVSEELRVMGRLNDCGGMPFLTKLVGDSIGLIHAEDYGRVVERAYLRRDMKKAAAEIDDLADNEPDFFTAWESGRRRLDAVLPKRLKTSGLRRIDESYSSFFDQVMELYENPDMIPGIASGFTDLDNITGGWQDTDLVILAGRPGMGKTSIMTNMMVNAAKNKIHSAFFSLEMSEAQVMARIVSGETGINSRKFRRRLPEDELKLFISETQKVSGWNLFIDDTPAQTVSQIRAKCLHLKSLGLLDMIWVDHLGEVGADKKIEQRHEQVAQIARDLKNLAKELRVPVFAAAQLSRAVEQRQDKRPLMSDLAESGNIERVADMIMFLYRDEYYNEATDRPNEADVIVAKHRNGPTGNAVLFFRKELTQFANLAKTKVDLEGAW